MLDVDFSTPSDPASDQAFVEALRAAAGSVVLPSFKQPGASGATAAVTNPATGAVTGEVALASVADARAVIDAAAAAFPAWRDTSLA